MIWGLVGDQKKEPSTEGLFYGKTTSTGPQFSMWEELNCGTSKVLTLVVQAQGLSFFPDQLLLLQCISHPLPRDTWKTDVCASPASPRASPIWYNSTPTFRLQDASAAHTDPLPHNPLSPALHTHLVTQSPPLQCLPERLLYGETHHHLVCVPVSFRLSLSSSGLEMTTSLRPEAPAAGVMCLPIPGFPGQIIDTCPLIKVCTSFPMAACSPLQTYLRCVWIRKIWLTEGREHS